MGKCDSETLHPSVVVSEDWIKQENSRPMGRKRLNQSCQISSFSNNFLALHSKRNMRRTGTI